MKKVLNLLLIISILSLPKVIFASDVNTVEPNLNNSTEIQFSKEPTQHEFEMYAASSAYKSFDKMDRWAGSRYIYAPINLGYIYVDVSNHGSNSINYTIANNATYLYSNYTGTIGARELKRIRVKASDMYNPYKESNGDPNFAVFVQLTAPGRRVTGAYRIVTE